MSRDDGTRRALSGVGHAARRLGRCRGSRERRDAQRFLFLRSLGGSNATLVRPFTLEGPLPPSSRLSVVRGDLSIYVSAGFLFRFLGEVPGPETRDRSRVQVTDLLWVRDGARSPRRVSQ